MRTGEDNTPKVYKDVPFDLVEQLVRLYDARDIWDEASGTYQAYTEKIEKIKAVLEYIATGGIN